MMANAGPSRYFTRFGLLAMVLLMATITSADCVKDIHGQVFCSSEVGGAALVDSHGRVRCYGHCEPGTADNCENTRAGS